MSLISHYTCTAVGARIFVCVVDISFSELSSSKRIISSTLEVSEDKVPTPVESEVIYCKIGKLYEQSPEYCPGCLGKRADLK